MRFLPLASCQFTVPLLFSRPAELERWRASSTIATTGKMGETHLAVESGRGQMERRMHEAASRRCETCRATLRCFPSPSVAVRPHFPPSHIRCPLHPSLAQSSRAPRLECRAVPERGSVGPHVPARGAWCTTGALNSLSDFHCPKGNGTVGVLSRLTSRAACSGTSCAASPDRCE